MLKRLIINKLKILAHSLDDNNEFVISNDIDKLASQLPKMTVMDDGTKVWYINGKLHNEDGPAMIMPDGSIFYYVNGKKHRSNDLPAVELSTGKKEWWINGKKHRIGGPAVTSEYRNEWWLDGIGPMNYEEYKNNIINKK